MENKQPFVCYENEAKLHIIAQREFRRKFNINAILRLTVFVSTLVALYFSFTTNAYIVGGVLLTAIIAFLFLVKKSIAYDFGKRWHKILQELNEKEKKSLQGDSSEFDSGDEFLSSNHSFSYDLDMFGESGFFSTLNRTNRPGSKNILANWIENPLVVENEIVERQKSFQELAPSIKWRQKFLAYSTYYLLTKETNRAITTLSEMDIKIPAWIKCKLLQLGLPILTFLAITLNILSILPAGYWILLVLLQWALTGLSIKYFNKANNAVGHIEKIMSTQAKLIQMVIDRKWKTKNIRQLQQTFTHEKKAIPEINNLAAILKSMEYRNNLIVGFLANSLLLWDIHCLVRFNKWHCQNSKYLAKWMLALDEIDAYISCSNYVYNHSNFVFPKFTHKMQFETKQLGHPLLDENKRVLNDYKLNKSTSFHIITGANMAGKSTFLRTISLNMVMAMIGLPVCAQTFVFKPVNIFTSMRTTDSLSKDESYFYAELKRLKVAYERIRSGEEIMLVLDEILKGTNSEDKRQGSFALLKKLMNFNVTGIIATHDTQLGDLENLFPNKVKNYCFETEIDGQEVNFDYKLKSGITKTMNARLLMEQMGLV